MKQFLHHLAMSKRRLIRLCSIVRSWGYVWNSGVAGGGEGGGGKRRCLLGAQAPKDDAMARKINILSEQNWFSALNKF
jgi:hypothetical protein